jgi:hypothetical protein
MASAWEQQILQPGYRGLGGTDAFGYLCLREPRLGPRLQHLIEKRELIGQFVVGLFHFGAGKRPFLELSERASHP